MFSISRQDLLEFLSTSEKPLTKREIVAAFNIKGDARKDLKNLLRDLEDDGHIIKQPGQTYTVPDGLPAVTVIEVTEIDSDGDVIARPSEWNTDLQGPPPRIEIVPDTKSFPKLKEGARALARLRKFTPDLYEAKIIKALDDERGRVLGLITQHKSGDFILQPADKRAKFDFEVPQKDLNNAKIGDLVVGEIQPARGLRRKKVRIIEVIGERSDPKAISLIAMHEAALRTSFPDNVIKAAQGLKVPPLKGREDLRDIPLVTIDGEDARDFDDAVFAQKTDDGYHLIVTIADVSYYVKPGSTLDQEAYKRGNSTYFPDRVLPMLPEELSNDLCSLRPHEDRACLAVHMWIDESGNLKKHKFVRGLMRSNARLIYEQVQAAKDGQLDDTTEPLFETVIQPLYAAYEILDKARQKRGALDLDLPERKILINEKGTMTGVTNRVRLNAHKLIEEFMILANVAAAQALENRRAPCVYRVHDKPSADKLDNAREFIESFGLPVPKSGALQPSQINAILKKASTMEYSHLISETILRTQSQAVYATQNIGHFGLALSKYAHFTSPIRRYADLLVHRSLVRAYGLGAGGLDDGEIAALDEKAEHISQTERTSAEAERSSIDRFTASWLSERIGAEFPAKINGVTRFGLFITLDENGADGLVPIRSLPEDFYVHDEQQHALIGRRRGRVYRLGAALTVRLKEADALTGSSIFELVGDKSADIPGFQTKIKQSNKRDKFSKKPRKFDKKRPDKRKKRSKSGPT